MAINQLSVFVENRKGKLSECLKVLGEAGVDIRATSIADTKDFGILRIIVSDTNKAKEALKDAGFIVANAGKWGVLNTLPTTEHPDPVPCDNIIVTPNIKIEDFKVHTAPWMNDHAILYIDVTL